MTGKGSIIYVPFISKEGDELSIKNKKIDVATCARVMRLYGYKSRVEAINFALRVVAVKPLSIKKVLQLRGSGWEGELDEMRGTRKF